MKALDGVSVSFPEKGFIFINGVSGSGKTTLMNMLSGLDSPTSGEIFYQESNITEYSQKEWDRFRNLKIGIVFQSFNLLDDLSVQENLMLPLKIQEFEEPVTEEQVKKILGYIGLPGYEKTTCCELSAGQKQRLAIARAIIKNPDIVIADEATGNLDPQNTESVLQLFNHISKERLVILISHDIHAAKEYGDRIITLSEGRIVSDVDNTMIKHLSEYGYDVTVDNGKNIKSVVLNKWDIREEIVADGKWNNDHFEDTRIVLSVHCDQPAKITEGYIGPIGVGKEKRLPFKDILGHTIYFFRTGGGRSFLTLMLVAFISALFFTAVLLTQYDYGRTVLNYMEATGANAFPVEMVIASDSAHYVSCGNTYLKKLVEDTEGYYLKEGTLKELYYSEKTSDDEVNVSYTGFETYGVWNTRLWYADDPEPFSSLILKGNYPNGIEEIAISQSLADKMKLGIGAPVWINGKEMHIVGIMDLCTSDGSDEPYAALLVTKEFEMLSLRLDKGGHSLGGVDITLSGNPRDYAFRNETFGCWENSLESEDLLWGRIPEKDNEVVISAKKAEVFGDYKNELFTTNYRLPNLSDPQYGGEYDGIIDLSKIIGKNVVIVGIYDDEKCLKEGNILFSKKVYEKLIEEYMEYYSFERCWYIEINNGIGRVSAMTEDGFQVIDSVAAHIYSNRNLTNRIKKVLWIVIGILFVMETVLLVAFLSYNVKDHAKRIGILRILGTGHKDINRIYLLNSLYLSLVSLLMAIVATIGIISYLSKKDMDLNAVSALRYEMISADYRLLILLFCIVLVVSIVVTWIPLKIMSRKNTIHLLQE